MKTHPILFNGDMVRAILGGNKTQTRRILKGSTEHKGEYNPAYLERHKDDPGWKKICPHGQLGDLLWVREHFGYHGCGVHSSEWHNTYVSLKYHADGYKTSSFKDISGENHLVLPNELAKKVCPKQNIKGLYEMDEWERGYALSDWWKKKKSIPSIHMPRPYSRITLEIKDIRVERLHDITGEDAIAEGINSNNPVLDFDGLWTKMNGPESWWANPWVWVIEFETHLCNIDEYLKKHDDGV